jgi:hypothetical protein
MDLRLCDCGSKARYVTYRVCEDAVESWIECRRGCAQTDEIEDAYGDYETSAYNWNHRKLKARHALSAAPGEAE